MRILRVLSMVAALGMSTSVMADACPVNASGPLSGPVCVAPMPGVDAAALVRAVRESERWIQQADSLLLRLESVWARLEVPKCETSHLGALAAGQTTGRLAATPPGRLEYAVDRDRVRFLDDQPGQCRTLTIWDGRQLTACDTPEGRKERYVLDRTPQGNFDDIFASETAWPRAQPHSFWWDSRDVDDLLAYFGLPEEFQCVAREDYRGVECHVLELRPTEVRAILHGQSYGCEGMDDQQEHGLIGEVRGLADQSCRWYIGVHDGRLRGIVWLIAERPRIEHWLSDYRQVATGWWFPMTQGYQIYNKDSDGRAYVESRRDLKTLEIKVNEPLPDELFQIEVKEGARVEDRRSGQTIVYEHRPKPPELLGRPLPPLNQSFTQLDLKSAEARPILVCFWDLHQRPSRHCILELARQTPRLGNVQVIAVQTARLDPPALNAWVRDNGIPFPVIAIADNPEKTLSAWNVRSLPWLVLTDQNHIVKANGFPLHELATQLADATGPTRQLASAR